MKISIGCSVKRYFAGVGDKVRASWSVEQFGFTIGNKYEIKGISLEKNLIIENDKGEMREYSPLHFGPVI